jgi:hypothetical protein
MVSRHKNGKELNSEFLLRKKSGERMKEYTLEIEKARIQVYKRRTF